MHARGRGRLRRPDGLHRAGRGRPAPHRGADPRRRHRHRRGRDPPLRARLLGAAAPPEGHRDRAGAQPRPGAPGPDVRRRGALRARDRLPQRRHRGVPARPRGPLRLHRDEPPHPGRAHRDRGGHRRRPRAEPDADRLRRDAGRPRPLPGHRPAARRGPAVPDHHRGPRQRVPARHGQDHDLPLPRRGRRPPRRGDDVHRGRGLGALRLDAGQAHLPGPHLREGGGAGAAGAGGVPDPWRLHEHPVRPGRAGGPRLRRREGDDGVHREPPAAADGAGPGRPRHQAADLPRGRDGQPAARRRARRSRPRHQAPLARPAGPGARRLAAAAARGRPGGVRPAAARPGPGRGHRDHVPRRPPVAARDPGPHPRPRRRRRLHRADDPAAVVAGGLGRCDVRRGAALPRRGPVGAAGHDAPGRAQHLPADAAARVATRSATPPTRPR